MTISEQQIEAALNEWMLTRSEADRRVWQRMIEAAGTGGMQ